MKNIQKDKSWEDYLDYFWHELMVLGKEHELYYRKITDKELLAIFPEVKTKIIFEKLTELDEEKEKLVKEIQRQIKVIRKIVIEKDRWFYLLFLKHSLVSDLLLVEKQISYFLHLKYLGRSRGRNKEIWQEKVTRALEYPIEDIVSRDITLRRSGQNLIGRCPLHEEKTPSFYIYLKNNSFYCFGCSQGGNVINYVMKRQNLTFKEAVEYLIHY
jgi:hypothetical protein